MTKMTMFSWSYEKEKKGKREKVMKTVNRVAIHVNLNQRGFISQSFGWKGRLAGVGASRL